jgi:hypothetical protein
MVFGCNLPKIIWTEVVNATNYLVNKSPTKANFSTSHEEFFSGKVHDLSHLHDFGCEAYVNITNKYRESKLSPRAIKCIFVGYNHRPKAYRCFNPIVRNILITRNIHFNEDMFNPTKNTKINNQNHIENITIQSFGSCNWTSSPSLNTSTKIQAKIHTHPIEISPSHDVVVDDSSFENRPTS